MGRRVPENILHEISHRASVNGHSRSEGEVDLHLEENRKTREEHPVGVVVQVLVPPEDCEIQRVGQG